MTGLAMLHDPATCRHERIQRIGIQRSPYDRIPLYLVTCRACGTTLTTRTLRDRGRRGPGKSPKS